MWAASRTPAGARRTPLHRLGWGIPVPKGEPSPQTLRQPLAPNLRRTVGTSPPRRVHPPKGCRGAQRTTFPSRGWGVGGRRGTPSPEAACRVSRPFHDGGESRRKRPTAAKGGRARKPHANTCVRNGVFCAAGLLACHLPAGLPACIRCRGPRHPRKERGHPAQPPTSGPGRAGTGDECSPELHVHYVRYLP